MDKRRGFITVATGDEKYYKLAANLCLSYKVHGKGSPFALICDRENAYTELFDDVVLVQKFGKNTIDKLLMWQSPYEETIFIDADSLVLGDIDDLWSVFEDQDDVTAFGCVWPLDSQRGWFTYEGSGKYKPQIKYLIDMHGGIYYFRKTAKAEKVFRQAVDIIDDYSTIDFKYFDTPQDEPLMAMSMILNECVPCDVHYELLFLGGDKSKVRVDADGIVYENNRPSGTKLIHFSAPKTKLFMYNYLVDIMRRGEQSKTLRNYWRMRIRYAPVEFKFNLYHCCGAVLRKLGLSTTVSALKKIIH